MVGRYLARFDETVLLFFFRAAEKKKRDKKKGEKKTKKKKLMEESEVIEGKATQGNNFDTEKENFALKSKGKIL